jgi:hypothetical protein
VYFNNLSIKLRVKCVLQLNLIRIGCLSNAQIRLNKWNTQRISSCRKGGPLSIRGFVLGHGEVANEVNGTSRVDNTDLRLLETFIRKYRPARALVVCNEAAAG